jgi:lipoyl-dependent peroxiredoxin
VIRKASSVWHGSGRGGKGELSTAEGVLTNTLYPFQTRFDSEQGTCNHDFKR